MDRDEIERRDFPAARRGYAAAAVDDHLRHVADEFEALGRAAANRPPPPASQAASTQVRAILEAAEASAQQVRAEAQRDAGGHVARVEAAAEQLVGKLERLQAELDRLLAGLRETAATHTSPAVASAADADGRSDDEAGARLVALNMALEGASRDEAARFLTEHYVVEDVEALLDAVYTSAGR